MKYLTPDDNNKKNGDPYELAAVKKIGLGEKLNIIVDHICQMLLFSAGILNGMVASTNSPALLFSKVF
jgi:hypothetical protein